MTVPGRGGLPPRRPDQVYSPPAPGIPPGSAAGILRAFELILFGTGPRGVFVYSGTPAFGNPPVITLTAPGVTQDPYKNPVRGGGLSITFGGRTIFLGDVGGIPELEFLTGSADEAVAANVAGNISGTAPAQFLQMLASGPKANVTGSQDWVQIEFNSSAFDASATASMFFNYIGTGGGVHGYAFMDGGGFSITAGSICAAHPGNLPIIPETWQTLALVNGYSAGSNNGFIDVPQVRMMADNMNLQFKGTLTTPNPATSTVFSQMPSGYPNANLGGCFGMGVVANLAGGAVDHVQVHNNGNISLNNLHNAFNFDLSCMVPTQ
jgi:hypothetical protein